MAGGGVLAAPWIVPSAVLGQEQRPAPSNRINLASIGVGWRGMANLEAFLSQADCQVRAVCDVDQEHAEAARSLVDRKYANKDCRVYYDFRELLARPDLDALALALPLHWHSIPAVLAAKAGFDIYGETPLAHTVREGRAICRTVERYARVWQTGSWQRSEPQFRRAVDIVKSGRIGKVHSVEVGMPGGHVDYAGTAGLDTPVTPPPGLDYGLWLGPAPWAPYCPARVHRNWRWHLDYGGGQLMDWVGHHVDIAQWALGLDKTGPVEVEGSGDYPVKGLWNAPTRFLLTARYQSGVRITVAGGHSDLRMGICWKGENGTVWAGREGLEATPQTLLDQHTGASDGKSGGAHAHYREFLDNVKHRRQTGASAEAAQRAATVGHLGMIAMKLGRKISWNPAAEEIPNDEMASRLLGKTMREPWTI